MRCAMRIQLGVLVDFFGHSLLAHFSVRSAVLKRETNISLERLSYVDLRNEP